MRALLKDLTSLCVFSVVIYLICSSHGFAWIDPASCMGAWLFDEDGAEIVEDVSGNEHSGTVKGDPEWEDGKFGMALRLDGQGDYVDFGDRDTLDVGESDFSIVAWLKCAEYTPPGWRNDIVNKLDTTQPRHGYTLSVRGDSDPANQEKPVVILGLGQDSGQHMFGQSPINDDTWHHLALTVDRHGSMILYRDGEIESQTNIAAYSGTALILYKDGEEAARKSAGGELMGNDEPVTIRSRWESGQSFKGAIDDVRIYNRALSQEEIKQVMEDEIRTAVDSSGKLAATWGMIKG